MADRTLIDNLAAGVTGDPARFALCEFYHEAVVATLNVAHHNGEQDALALFEALAMVLGQVAGNLSPQTRSGALAYITTRAETHAPTFASAGKAARFYEEPTPEVRHG